jgi:hypothetical protein
MTEEESGQSFLPEEYGEVIEWNEKGQIYMLRLDPIFRQHRLDDGLIEIDPEFVEAL